MRSAKEILEEAHNKQLGAMHASAADVKKLQRATGDVTTVTTPESTDRLEALEKAVEELKKEVALIRSRSQKGLPLDDEGYAKKLREEMKDDH